MVLIRRPRPSAKSRARPERAEHFRKLRSLALDLRKRGYSYREIAKRTGLSRSATHNYARKVKIAELQGSAWLGLSEVRPKEWKKLLMAQTSGPFMHRLQTLTS
jgi:DNA invertase Pin-like site-specific DNA recombinase